MQKVLFSLFTQLQVMNDALNETVKNVNQIFRHPDFNPTTLDNDIAILNIQSFKWSSEAEMLTAIDAPSNATECQVIGWGKSENSEPFLQKISAVITDDAVCSRKYSYDSKNKFCVEGRNNACLEEPGSGLICDGDLTGVLSYGNACSERGQKQMVYTDLTKYNIWIDEVFRTLITKKSDNLPAQTVPSTQTERTTSPVPRTTTRTTTSLKPQSYTSPPVSQYPSSNTPVQEESEGHW